MASTPADVGDGPKRGEVVGGKDAADLAVFETRAREPALPFEALLKDLKRRGKL